jgi:hypothetical protein
MRAGIEIKLSACDLVGIGLASSPCVPIAIDPNAAMRAGMELS